MAQQGNGAFQTMGNDVMKKLGTQIKLACRIIGDMAVVEWLERLASETRAQINQALLDAGMTPIAAPGSDANAQADRKYLLAVSAFQEGKLREIAALKGANMAAAAAMAAQALAARYDPNTDTIVEAGGHKDGAALSRSALGQDAKH